MKITAIQMHTNDFQNEEENCKKSNYELTRYLCLINVVSILRVVNR